MYKKKREKKLFSSNFTFSPQKLLPPSHTPQSQQLKATFKLIL